MTAGNDANTANETINLTHGASTADGDYFNITIAGVTVTVEDNDTAKVTGVALTPGDGELAVGVDAGAQRHRLPGAVEVGRQSYNNSGRQATIGSGSTASHTIPSLTTGPRTRCG